VQHPQRALASFSTQGRQAGGGTQRVNWLLAT
jgi:hypothetical protein